MRYDMDKVIVERPRHGRGHKFPRGSARETDRIAVHDWHKREGVARRWQSRGIEKSLNENLSPLRRFLRSRVGRPWDKVYSEICERINRNSAVQLHIWQHLSDYVCTNPYEVEGYVGLRWHGFLRHEFHVDPRTGLLRISKRRTKRQWVGSPLRYLKQPPLPNPVVPINDNRCYELIDAIWYELDLRKPPADGKVYDTRFNARVPFNPRGGFREYRGRKLYVGARRRLDKREAERVGGIFRAQFEHDLRKSV